MFLDFVVYAYWAHVFWIERHLCRLPVLYVRSGDVCIRYVHFLYTGNQESCAGGSHRFWRRWCNSNRGKEWERQMQCRIKIDIEMNSVSDHRYQHHMADNIQTEIQPLFDIIRDMKIRCRKLIFTNRTPTDRVNVWLND